MNNPTSERVVEDILSSDTSILAEILSANPAHLSLVARQKVLESGRLDLLYLYQDTLLLIELKVGPFAPEVVQQTDQYFTNLLGLQAQHRLIDAPISKIVLVTEARPEDVEACKRASIRLVTYRPEFVFSRYFENFRELAYFLRLQSGDYGVVRLGLLKRTVQLVSEGKTVREICAAESRSAKTIRNRLSVAMLLGLVGKFKGQFFLTDFGSAVFADSHGVLDDVLDENQVEALADFVKANPFYSALTYTILAIVESVFVLARNRYPVPKRTLQDYFVQSVGKGQTWKANRARETATYIFSNYARELEFLAQVGNDFYVTPKGIRAVLLLQLNRSLKLIESQK
jgi:hypothetical protein